MLINLSCQIWVGFIFVYHKSLKQTFKIGFEFVFCAVNSQRLLCSQKAGVKCSIKAFWYTKKLMNENKGFYSN